MARGDVLRIEFPISQGPGSEQTGTRPAIAVDIDLPGSNLPTLMVVPLTSQLNAQRFPYTFVVTPSNHNGLTVPSVALCFQLRAIDRARVRQTIGMLEQQYMDQLTLEMKRMLGIP